MSRLSLVPFCLASFGFGMLLATNGPALVDVAHQTHVSLSQIGLGISCLFIGGVSVQFVVGPIVDRFGPRGVTIGSMLLIMVGLLGVSLSQLFPLTLASYLITGFGFSAVGLSSSIWVASLIPDRRVMGLNLLNMCGASGAILGPIVIGQFRTITGNGLMAYWCGIAIIAATLPWIARTPTTHGTQRGSPLQGLRRLATMQQFWLLGLLMLTYVGTENATTSWATTFLQRTTTLGLNGGTVAMSGFWLAIMLGRLAATIGGHRLSANILLMVCTSGALISLIGLLVGFHQTLITLGALWSLGFWFGPIYPTLLAMATERFPAFPGQATSLALAMGNLGGILVPWAQGILLINFGGIAMISYDLLLMVIMLGILSRSMITTRVMHTTKPAVVYSKE